MISSIELLAGASLNQMVHAQATYTVQRTAEETISITLAAPDLQAEGLHLQTWGSSYLLANRLHRIPVTFSEPEPEPQSKPESKSGAESDLESIPFSILELGAGTGLVGLSAATIWGRSAMLTDFASIVPGTAANVSLNRALLETHGGRVHCGSLDWNLPTTLAVAAEHHHNDSADFQPSPPPSTVLLPPSCSTRAHVILSADTLYTAEQPALLVACIGTWLARHADARAILCYPLRIAALEAIREFWALMDSAGFEAVLESQERVEGEEWDDEKLHEWAVFRWREVPVE